MRKDVLRKLERAIEPDNHWCVHVAERGRPVEAVHCQHFDMEIAPGACPGFNGQECRFSRGFSKIKYVRVEAGPRGEVVELSPPDHEEEE